MGPVASHSFTDTEDGIMSALPYHCVVKTDKGTKVSDTIWANSAEQAARRIERATGFRCVKVSDRNKKVA